MDESLERLVADAGLDASDLPPVNKPSRMSQRAQVRAMARAMVEALREQPGVHVRMPSAHAAPFRSMPASYHGRVVLTQDPAAGDRIVSFCPVTWGGDVGPDNATAEVALSTVPAIPEGDPFPEGLVGHVAVRVYGCAQAFVGGPFDATVNMRWTLFKNGQPPFGYQSRMPSTTIGATLQSALGALFQHQGNWCDVDTDVRAPLLLLPGDRLTVRVDRMPGATAGIAGLGIVVIEGWAYPVRRVSDDVRTTVTD